MIMNCREKKSVNILSLSYYYLLQVLCGIFTPFNLTIEIAEERNEIYLFFPNINGKRIVTTNLNPEIVMNLKVLLERKLQKRRWEIKDEKNMVASFQL